MLIKNCQSFRSTKEKIGSTRVLSVFRANLKFILNKTFGNITESVIRNTNRFTMPKKANARVVGRKSLILSANCMSIMTITLVRLEDCFVRSAIQGLDISKTLLNA